MLRFLRAQQTEQRLRDAEAAADAKHQPLSSEAKHQPPPPPSRTHTRQHRFYPLCIAEQSSMGPDLSLRVPFRSFMSWKDDVPVWRPMPPPPPTTTATGRADDAAGNKSTEADSAIMQENNPSMMSLHGRSKSMPEFLIARKDRQRRGTRSAHQPDMLVGALRKYNPDTRHDKGQPKIEPGYVTAHMKSLLDCDWFLSHIC